jgi:MFS family permease
MKDSPSSANKTILVLRWPILLCSLGFVFLEFALPVYGKALGATALEIGGFFSIFALVIALLRPVVGWALDRFGRKVFFVAAMVCYAAAMGLFSIANSVVGLYLGQVVRGIGSAMMWITAYTIATELAAGHARGQAVGRVDEAVGQGQLYGGLIGFAILFSLPREMGWQVVLAVYAAMAAVGAWLGWRQVPETRSSQAAPEKAEGALSRQLFKLMAVVVITAASSSMIRPVFLVFLQDRFTTSVSTLALVSIPAGIVAAYLPSRLGKLSDRLGRAPLMALGLIASGILSFLLPALPNIMWLAVLWTLESLGWAIAGPAEEAMVADLTGNEMRGRGYGLYTFAASCGAFIGPLAGGWLYDAAGHAAPFWLNGMVLLVGAGLVLLLFGRSQPGEFFRRRHADQPQ